MRSLLPPGWPRPRGYCNGIVAQGRLIFTAGVVGWNEAEQFTSHSLPGQFEQALRNTLAILAEGGAGPDHIARMTVYVTEVDLYRQHLKDIGAAWQRVIGRHYPAMALVGVTELVEPAALVEIETTAVVPE